MSLYALGLNHQTAPLAVRERVVFHVERLRGALTEVTKGLASEAAILSTCNRTELYFSGEQPVAAAEWLGQKVLSRGAGEMSGGCPPPSAARAPAQLAGATRPVGRAQQLARRFNGRAIELKTLGEPLHEHDIVVWCTASSLPILGKGLVE